MEELLRAVIVGAVAELIGGDAVVWGRRIGLPAVALHLIHGPVPDMTMRGPSGLEVGLVQVDYWGPTFAEASALARAGRGVLAGYRDERLRVLIEGGGSDFEQGDAPTDGGKPENFHRIRQDLRVWHRNP